MNLHGMGGREGQGEILRLGSPRGQESVGVQLGVRGAMPEDDAPPRVHLQHRGMPEPNHLQQHHPRLRLVGRVQMPGTHNNAS